MFMYVHSMIVIGSYTTRTTKLTLAFRCSIGGRCLIGGLVGGLIGGGGKHLVQLVFTQQRRVHAHGNVAVVLVASGGGGVFPDLHHSRKEKTLQSVYNQSTCALNKTRLLVKR